MTLKQLEGIKGWLLERVNEAYGCADQKMALNALLTIEQMLELMARTKAIDIFCMIKVKSEMRSIADTEWKRLEEIGGKVK